ncbi:MAG: hypothetical protein AAFV93_18035, partial [Chloroflexota bacterium]
HRKASRGVCTLPEMQALKPCARCEQEIPEAFFEGKDAVFCKRCADEINDILSKKYSVIEAAHFRAQMRLRSKNLQKKLQTQTSNQIAAAGD